VNPITNNYAQILCRLQYIFYRASFLIVINIHRDIEAQATTTTTTTTGAATIPEALRQILVEPLEQ